MILNLTQHTATQERDIQAVLNTVIRHGYYLPSSRIGFVPRMGMALINAEANKLITTKEYEKTIKAIRLYRGTDTTLARALLKSKLPAVTMTVYQFIQTGKIDLN